MSDWVPTPKDVAPELTDGFVHATFPPPKVHWSTVADQLDRATFEQLRLMANGGTGNPVVSSGDVDAQSGTLLRGGKSAPRP